MKLGIINRRTGATLSETDVLLGGYAVTGHILIEFLAAEHLHALCALALTPEEAAGFAARLNAMATLRRHQRAPDRRRA